MTSSLRRAEEPASSFCGARVVLRASPAEADAAGEGAKTRLDKLREGMRRLGNTIPVTEDDVGRYSQIIAEVMGAEEEAGLAPLLASNIDFLFNRDLAAISTQYRAR